MPRWVLILIQVLISASTTMGALYFPDRAGEIAAVGTTLAGVVKSPLAK